MVQMVTGTPRTLTLKENYVILEKLGLNIPLHKQFHSQRIRDAFKELDSIDGLSRHIGIRLEDVPNCTPKYFYSVVDRFCSECVYQKPGDRESDTWTRRPHLMGEYSKMKKIYIKIAEDYEFHGFMDYEIGGPYYSKTQEAGFNLYINSNCGSYIEIVKGRKTPRLLEEGVDAIVENREITKGSIDEEMENDLAVYSRLVEKLCQDYEVGDLTFPSSYHSIPVGSLRRKIVTWTILPETTKQGFESVKKLRGIFFQ